MSDSLTHVFISSTYHELVAYRQVARDAVWRAGMFPEGMERQDIALPISTTDASRRMFDVSQVFVLILSQRYGIVTAQEMAGSRSDRICPFWFS